MKGFLGHGSPVRRSRRSTLPPREVRSRGLVPTAASPVPTSSEPSRATRSRQPPWRPEVAGRPLSSTPRRFALVPLSFSFQATTRTSCPPPLVVAPWQVQKRPLRRTFGSTARPISPVSPETQTDSEGKSTRRTSPSSQIETVARSRSVSSRRPPPMGWTSQGLSSPSAITSTSSPGTARPPSGRLPAVASAVPGSEAVEHAAPVSANGASSAASGSRSGRREGHMSSTVGLLPKRGAHLTEACTERGQVVAGARVAFRSLDSDTEMHHRNTDDGPDVGTPARRNGGQR